MFQKKHKGELYSKLNNVVEMKNTKFVFNNKKNYVIM